MYRLQDYNHLEKSMTGMNRHNIGGKKIMEVGTFKCVCASFLPPSPFLVGLSLNTGESQETARDTQRQVEASVFFGQVASLFTCTIDIQ